MTQRRTPGGQGPARRPGRNPGRGAVRDSGRGAGRDSGRVAGRDSGRGAGRDSGRGAGRDAGRAGKRPGATRRTSPGGTTKRTTAPQPRRFTGRATVLVVVLTLLALGYTYPVRVYLAQEAEIARMDADQAAQRAKIEHLTQEVAKWHDPEYVKTQARRRLYYVPPGEVPLVVYNDPEGAARDAGKPPPTRPDPWYDTLWSSIEAADAEN